MKPGDTTTVQTLLGPRVIIVSSVEHWRSGGMVHGKFRDYLGGGSWRLEAGQC